MGPVRHLLIALAIVLPLSGCIEETTTLAVQPDGSGTMTLDITLGGSLGELAEAAGALGGNLRMAANHLRRYQGVAAWTDVSATPSGEGLRIQATGWFEDVTQVRRAPRDDGSPAQRTWSAQREDGAWLIKVSLCGPTLLEAGDDGEQTPLKSILDQPAESFADLEDKMPELLERLSEDPLGSHVRLATTQALASAEGWAVEGDQRVAGWGTEALAATLQGAVTDMLGVHRRFSAGELERAQAEAELDAIEARFQILATARIPTGEAAPTFTARLEAARATWGASEIKTLIEEPEEPNWGLSSDPESPPPAGLTRQEPDAFEPNQDLDHPAPLEPGRYENLLLDEADWYRLEVPGDQTLVVTLQYDESAGYVGINLYDMEGPTILGVEGGNAPHQTIMRHSQPPGEPATLLLEVGGLSDKQAYHLEIALEAFSAVDAYEPNDSSEQARPLAPGRHTELVCNPVDHYLIEAPAGAVVTVEAEYEQDAGNDPTLTLDLGQPESITQLATTAIDIRKGIGKRIRCRAPGGSLVLRVGSLDEDLQVPYTLTVQIDPDGLPADAFEPNQTERDARPLEPGTHALSCDPLDYFRVRVPAGKQARFAFQGELVKVHAELGGKQRIGGEGTDFAFAYGPGGDAEAELLLVVRAEDLRSYELTVVIEAWQAADRFEPNDAPALAKPLEPGNYTDLQCVGGDWYAIALVSGQTVTLDIDAEALLGLTLHHADGTQLAEASGWKRTKQLSHTATHDGVHLLHVGERYPRAAAGYRLQVAVE